MPILIPEKPSFANQSEKTAWKALQKSLPEDAYLLHGVRVTDQNSDVEADLVVIWPQNGIAFIEVKGGYISPNEDGTFEQGSGRHKNTIDPVGQIHGAMYGILGWFKDRTSLKTNFTKTFLVAFPDGMISSQYQNPKIRRSQIVDKDELNSIDSVVRKALENASGFAVSPDAEDCDRYAQALKASTIDATEVQDLAQIIDKRTEEIEKEISELEKLLEFTCDVGSFHVQGAAGTGKTAMALIQSRRLKQKGLRVAFLCYSKVLSVYIRHLSETLPKSERIDVIQTFHNLGKLWGVQIPGNPSNEYWSGPFSKEFLERATQAPASEKFDAIVIDESQDFDSNWWYVIESLLKNPESGGIFAFGDNGQGIFQRNLGTHLDLVPLRLHKNLRNAEPIARLAGDLTDVELPNLEISAPEVFYVEVGEENKDYDAMVSGDEALDNLQEIFDVTSIAYLTTKSRHFRHKELVESDPDEYVRKLWDDSESFYGTVSGFKGLERNCIVLVVNGVHEDQNLRELLYTGITRARDLLVIVSARSYLEQVLDAKTIDAFRRIELEV